MDKRDPVGAARASLAAGRPWEARDRLSGVLGQDPYDLEVQALLGQAWWQLGDPARAGRYWFLTGREGAEVDAAVEAWRAAQPSATQRARTLRLQPKSERSLAPAAAARLAALVAEVQEQGATWEPGHPVRVSGSGGEANASRTADVLGGLVVVLVLLATVGVWLVGVVALVRLLIG